MGRSKLWNMGSHRERPWCSAVASGPPGFRRKLNGSSLKHNDLSDGEMELLSECSPDKVQAVYASRHAAGLDDLGALGAGPECSSHAAELSPLLFSTHTTSQTFTHHPCRKVQSQHVYSSSIPRKRKYQITRLTESPLKLRITMTGAPPTMTLPQAFQNHPNELREGDEVYEVSRQPPSHDPH